MHKKSVYFINGIGIISPQKTFQSEIFLAEISEYTKNVLTCVTPDFKVYINPIQLRRLSRMLRIGLSAATICLRDASLKMPDGIITATGYGLLDETSKFLMELLRQKESQLTPTYFMQGTSNALSGVVALSMKCTGYNNTYVSKGFAFENALLDALMQLNENPSSNFLVGAYDEAAEVQYTASIRVNQYKTETISNLSLFESLTPGTIQGEGSAFIAISGMPSESTWCILNDLQMIYRPEADELQESLATFLNANNIEPQQIDVLISGASGNIVHDPVIASVVNSFFKETLVVRFKHLCGEYCTATSFAIWLAASILKRQEVPEIVKVQKNKHSPKLKTILIVNQYSGRNFSFILLSQRS